MRRLRTDLESAKARAPEATMQLQQAHSELSSVREEASRGSTVLAAARSELAEEVRWRTQLQQSPGPLLQVAGDASMNETRDQVI